MGLIQSAVALGQSSQPASQPTTLPASDMARTLIQAMGLMLLVFLLLIVFFFIGTFVLIRLSRRFSDVLAKQDDKAEFVDVWKKHRSPEDVMLEEEAAADDDTIHLDEDDEEDDEGEEWKKGTPYE